MLEVVEIEKYSSVRESWEYGGGGGVCGVSNSLR